MTPCPIVKKSSLQGDPVYNHQGPTQNHMQQMQPRPVQGPLPPPQQQQQIHYQQTQQVLFTTFYFFRSFRQLLFIGRKTINFHSINGREFISINTFHFSTEHSIIIIYIFAKDEEIFGEFKIAISKMIDKLGFMYRFIGKISLQRNIAQHIL